MSCEIVSAFAAYGPTFHFTLLKWIKNLSNPVFFFFQIRTYTHSLPLLVF